MDVTFELLIEAKLFELGKIKKLLTHLNRDDFVESTQEWEVSSNDQVTIVSLFDETKDVLLFIEAKVNQDFEARTEIREYSSRLWKEAWESDFKNLESDYFTFQEGSDAATETNELEYHPAKPSSKMERIYLSSEGAFGKGDHATTKATLALLEKALTPSECRNKTFLDVGCGTGVFAIWAEKFGFQSVVATDIDPAAITSTKKNKKKNRCVFEVYETPIPPAGKYHVIVSNILPPALNLLFPLFKDRLANDGHLFLSGFNEANFVDVEADWIRSGFILVNSIDERGWSAVQLGHL
ncbi:MAG: 50S ribosomal protein L11 methyltransferase [Pseudomonadota bacterium]